MQKRLDGNDVEKDINNYNSEGKTERGEGKGSEFSKMIFENGIKKLP